MNFKNCEQTYVETLHLLCKYGGRIGRHGSQVLEIALERRSLQALRLLLDAGAQINHRNPSGYTPVHLCVKLRLKKHLKVLTYHSSAITRYMAMDVTDKEGSTVLHWAARAGWLDGITIALEAGADINRKNSAGDTALHLAAKAGHYDIVKQTLFRQKIKQILDHYTNRECNLSEENDKGETPFSNAISSGNAHIVKLMLDRNNDLKYLFNRKIGELTPLQYAAANQFQELFVLIFHNQERKGFIHSFEIYSILTAIAEHNLGMMLFEIIKETFKYMDIRANIYEHYILHKAIKHNSRMTISGLLLMGVNLAQKNEDGQPAINLLMYHVPNPTELLTEILDGCFRINKHIYHKDCEISIRYRVLMPPRILNCGESCAQCARHQDQSQISRENDMKVLEALIEIENEHDHLHLLTHPVIETFLYLKWKNCAKFFYLLITLFVLFLVSLNIFCGTFYYHLDKKKQDTASSIRLLFNPSLWRISTLFTLCLFFIVDLPFWTSYGKKWYFNITFWVKLLIIIGVVTMIIFTSMDAADNDIIRGVAVITVSLSWIYLMILLSWTPTFGFYTQMYWEMSMNLIKSTRAFSLPLIGFSICFMILLRSKEPFDGPVAAFLKTMVMMSSEFEYENLVKNEDSIYMLRIFFLLFFVFCSLVLMNLMLGVVVTDYQKLIDDGKKLRLKKQVQCICMLEKLFQQRTFKYTTLKLLKMKNINMPPYVTFKPNSKMFNREIRKTILNKAKSLIGKQRIEKEEVLAAVASQWQSL